MTSTLSSVTDGQLCDDAGVPGCAPKVVVQDNAAKTVVTSNPTNVVTQSGGATIVTSPSAPRVMTTSQAVQVVVNNQAPVNVNTGCCPSTGSEGATLPPGGTLGQALRKQSATDGDADWSPFWVVDPTTGKITNNVALGTIDPYTAPAVGEILLANSTFADAFLGDQVGRISMTSTGNISATVDIVASSPASTQRGLGNLQIGGQQTQSGTPFYCAQIGFGNTQQGGSSLQVGASNTQSGYYSYQGGALNTQSGMYGFQSGESLNDGGFNYTFMTGISKTATVGKRAYFALDNGIWLKPKAGDAASPENGVLHYNSTLGKFRAYEGGAWKNLTDSIPSGGAAGAPLIKNSAVDFAATWSSGLTVVDARKSIQVGDANTISGGGSGIQIGEGNTRTSGVGHAQFGENNTQSGYYDNIQSGNQNTQSGDYGAQFGSLLNDGGFSNTFMTGISKTATVGKRAYFALDNGIWLKPKAGDAASPENGVIGYNSTTHKFRGYANGAWVDLH